MITLAVFNLVFVIFDWLCTHVFSQFYNDAITYQNVISGWSVPSTLVDIMGLTKYFIPFATITVLFDITVGLVLIALIYALVYMFLNVIKQLPLL